MPRGSFPRGRFRGNVPPVENRWAIGITLVGMGIVVAMACGGFSFLVGPTAVRLVVGALVDDRDAYTESADLAPDERAEFARRYTTLVTEPRDIAFLIAYDDTQSKSEANTWDIRVGVLVEPAQVAAWVANCDRSAEETDAVWTEHLRSALTPPPELTSSPVLHRCGGEWRLVYGPEGVIFTLNIDNHSQWEPVPDLFAW